MILLFVSGGFLKINESKGGSESYNYCGDGDKYIGAVAYKLMKHSFLV